MKKLFCLIITVALFMHYAGVDAQAKPFAKKAAKNQVSQKVTAPPTEKDLRELFDRNLACWLNIYGLDTLNFEQTPYRGTLHKVTDKRFPTWDALEKFTRQTYQTSVAEELLFKPRVENHYLYQEVDGLLCIDTYVIGGMGYYVDWSSYKITIDSCSNAKCRFTVTAVKEDVTNDFKKIPFICKATAVYQDGTWVLTEMVY